MDRDNNNFELARFTIHSGLTGNALVPCVLLRHSGHFELRTLAHCTSGRTVRMLRDPLGLLLKDLSSGHNKVHKLCVRETERDCVCVCVLSRFTVFCSAHLIGVCFCRSRRDGAPR